ncbi:class F sortase [Actinokineospora enzanensis]|uniref:class F sortase n=1 Tax=Actinokineospora enzanensis TaxID=155975 RepID=UPI0003603421|nr:class F sortase [Actinokineospora enzanensis]
MARRGSRLAPPATAAGAGLLIALISGLAFAGPVHVEGMPLPGRAGLAQGDVRRAADESSTTLAEMRLQVGPAPTTPTPPAPGDAPPPTRAPAPPPVPAAGPAEQRPGTLRLAKGGTATLVRKELSADATLPVPTGVHEATWWGAGLTAASGATVFAGHVNWRGQTGPFAELWDARVGDPVSVVDAGGQRFRFRVSQVETVHKDDLPNRAEEFFGQTGPHRVVLVTCGGRWVGGHDGYESNRVVVAVPE